MTAALVEPAGMQDRAAWLAWRRGGIGASDIAAVLSISPWASPWSTWADKTGLLPGDGDLDDDDPREFGRRAEAMIAPWFADRTGLHVTGEQSWCVHPDEPWMRATPDGCVVESSTSTPADALGGLEIKTDFGRPWDEIPGHYQAQGQWQMAVTGWERVWFAVLHGRRFRTYVLDRNDDDIAFMVERAARFWVDHVLGGTPPPTDGHDATLRALAAVYPTHTPGVSVDIDPHLVRIWNEAKEQRRAAKSLEDSLAAEIQAALGDAEEGVVDGQRVVSWRSQTRKSYVVNEATFRVLRPHRPKERAS